MHPLCGADFRTLYTSLRANGGVAPSRLPQAAIAVLTALARWPFSAAERLAVARLRQSRPAVPAPVFIIGHWRSGTTHLCNVLSRAPDFGYVPPLAPGLPWDLLGLARALRPLLERALPTDRFVDRVAVNPDSPQEDEIALASMTPLSYYHGIYFPKRFEEQFNRGVFFDGCTPEEIANWRTSFLYLLDKLAIYNGGRRLLLKNPVYTARVAMLHALLPGAKFIHIHRNPYVVFPSTRHFYRKLLQEFALQQPPEIDLDGFVLGSYTRVMRKYVDEARTLPPGTLAEIRFEDFERDPLGELARVYDELGLEGFEDARGHFSAYLASVRDYRKNRYTLPRHDAARVHASWQPFLARWGYGLPEGLQAA